MIAQVVDPWAGSYMMEALTEELITKANAIIDEVGEAMGGTASHISLGMSRGSIGMLETRCHTPNVSGLVDPLSCSETPQKGKRALWRLGV
jgi:hypothetical protein